jgi:HD-like signal output (HDOD) protein
MATKSILLAIADPEALAAISHALGTEWMPTPVRNEPEAIAQLKRYSFSALLVDFNLGSPDASELLNLALEEHPETSRFLLVYEADLALVAAKVTGTHHILPKPIEFASLTRRIEEAVEEEDAECERAGEETAASQRTKAKIPAVYSEVLKAFEAPEVTSEELGGIIARDEALTAEVIRLAASGYLGLPRNLTRPAEAVESLGLEAVKTLVMARRYLAENSHLKPGYLSFDELWQHSTQVAQMARDLVLFETRDRALAASAFAAGLVHDLGKVVLVTNFDDLYGRVHSLARKQPVALWEVEKEMFGANHAEIGGCLVGMWNLPGQIVEATALHHEPAAGDELQLTPLAAVHIANVLEHQLRASEEFRIGPAIDTRFLNGLGLLQRLPVWRAAFANRSLVSAAQQEIAPAAEVESAEVSAFEPSAPALSGTSQAAGPVAATRTATIGQPEREAGARAPAGGRFPRRLWVYAGIAAAALLILLTLWLKSSPGLNPPDSVRARTSSEASLAVAPLPAPELVAVAVPRAEPEDVVRDQEAPTTSAAPITTPAPVSPAPEPAPAQAVVSPAAVTNAAPPGLSAQVKAPAPEFRLNGIIYTATNPSAIVNGATVRVGDKVNGATVIGIKPNEVTLQSKGQIRTFVLR